MHTCISTDKTVSKKKYADFSSQNYYIIVLSKGWVLEYDTPQNLPAEDSSSPFYELVKHARIVRLQLYFPHDSLVKAGNWCIHDIVTSLL
jgi:hypothetical protein